MKNQLLWNQIKNFELDKPNVDFTFSQRLAKENNWTQEYCNRVILEYKKYIYLCSIQKHAVVPSEAVDQAWHLHLTYTKSYWIELCQNTLKRDIHHNPTRGGLEEKNKFSKLYDKTLEAYKNEFNQSTPEDIWPVNQKKVKTTDYRKIDLNQNWIFPKPRKAVSYSLMIALFSIFTIVLFVQAEGSSPFVIIVIFVVIAFIAFKSKNNGFDGDDCNSCCNSCCGD